MKKIILTLLLCLPLFNFPLQSVGASCGSNDQSSKAREIIEKVFKAIDNIKTLKYNLRCTERIGGKLIKTESAVKLQISPRKLYLYVKGAELLWVQDWNKGLALINPGGFPYFALNLEPENTILRKDQHHTIHEMGFVYFQGILKDAVKKVGNDFDKYFILNGEEKANNRDCYKFTILNPDFAWVEYTVLKGEDILSIARKLSLSEYMILENNPKHSSFKSVKEGDKINIPNTYAKMTEIFVDKLFHLPIVNKVYDDKGLFEQYDYNFLQVNPKIADEEFTRNYKDYHF